MIERGELRLPEMQRRYVWRVTRVRYLLDAPYRGYPGGRILVWEIDDHQPSRDLSVTQQPLPFAGHKLLLDGQQPLTSLSAVLRGEHVEVRGWKQTIDILLDLDHPDGLVDRTAVENYWDSAFADDEEMAEANRTGKPYQTCLDPPPADPSYRHPEATLPSWAKPIGAHT
jgi:hypothetical protein